MVDYEIYVDKRTGEHYVLVPTAEYLDNSPHYYRLIEMSTALTIANRYFRTKKSNLVIGSAIKTNDTIQFFKEYDECTGAVFRIANITSMPSNRWVIARKGKVE